MATLESKATVFFRARKSHLIDRSRHLFQQPAQAFDRLSHVQPFFDRPDSRWHGMHNRHLQVFFKQMNDVEAAPTRAEHVDPFSAWVFQKGLPRVRINFLKGKPSHVFEGNRDSFHGHDVEAGVAEITRCDIVDAVDEVSYADEL